MTTQDERRKRIHELKRIHAVFIRATQEGQVPSGYYGPGTCRWATREEMVQFGLVDCPLVHLNINGEIDCYFTETEAVALSTTAEEEDQWQTRAN
jgi:hypothetical protein